MVRIQDKFTKQTSNFARKVSGDNLKKVKAGTRESSRLFVLGKLLDPNFLVDVLHGNVAGD